MQNLVFPKPEVRWGCLMLNHNYLPTKASNDVPLELSSILLVEQGSELRDSRRLLLDSMGHPVLVVSAFADVCKLPRDSNCCLIALDLNPNEHQARPIAAHARLTWPGAKILLLGHPSENSTILSMTIQSVPPAIHRVSSRRRGDSLDSIALAAKVAFNSIERSPSRESVHTIRPLE